MRIACKKLRYLLEFFRSVFEPQRVAPLVRSLKGLQDYLGEFNDLTVQQRELRAMAAEMHGRGVGSTNTVLAMGGLIGRLEQRQADLKRRLLEAVRSFVGKPNRAAFRELLR